MPAPTAPSEVQPPAPTASPTTLPTAAPTRPPTATPPPPTATPDPALAQALGPFAGLFDNQATGAPAPDFSARVLGGWTFVLSAQRGSWVLVIPTVVGCGDCVFTMQELAQAYPEFQGRGLQVVLLNLYPQDVPESWNFFVDLYPEQDFLWAVVDSPDFVVDYNIQTLGTSLLIDPEGRLVFRQEYPLLADEFRQLFALALAEQEVSQDG